MEQKEQKAEKEICVCRIIDGKYESTFETNQAVDFLELACRLREMLRSGTLTGEALAATFASTEPIDQDGLDVRINRFMANSGEIRGMFYLNLNRRLLSVLDRAEGWWDYLVKDVSAAAYCATRKEGRPEREQRQIFLDRLREKIQGFPLNPDARPTFGMQV